jgi:nucleotide-binding universal stress UspA family protein
MKKFLFPTDFSANAKHALDYGYSLAKQAQANIMICNAVITPAEIPQAGLVSWPIEEYDLLEDDSKHELRRIKKHLKEKEQSVGFNPSITCIEQTGTVIDVVNGLSNDHEIGLVVIGTHGSSGLSTLLLGNHSRELIDEVNKPLLLVPPSSKIVPIKKIAFATDFKDPVKDLKCINELIILATPLNAEILITNIFDEDKHNPEIFMHELATRTNYPLIYYRLVESNTPESGLDWLCEHGDIDMLAMVHRNHNFIDSLFKGSQTQKMADHISIPLLVFPADND